MSAEEKHLFFSCFQAANKDLLIDFNGESAVQIKGLAMGIACSPDLANLYGAHFEELILSDNDLSSRIPFFGRYLDDVLCIVYANDAAEATALATQIRYDGVEIEWSCSEWHTPFLDLFVYIDPADGQVHHKPYSKPMNHRERIPWASHHPKDVKKGTFIGEMSRLAALSSKPEHYLEAVEDLKSLYIARGYPTDLVRKWIREHCSKRWDNRHSEPRASSEVFVLKSHYNPAWSAFNIQELGKIVETSWRSSLIGFADQAKQRRLMAAPASPGPHVHELGPPLPMGAALPRVNPQPDTVQRLLTDLWRRPVDNDTAGSEPGAPVSVPRSSTEDGPLYPDHDSIAESTSGGVIMSASTGQGGAAGSPSSLGVPRSLPTDDWVETGRLTHVTARQLEVERVINVASIGYFDKRWLVSRKKNKTLGDLTNQWRKTLLNKAEEIDPEFAAEQHLDDWV